MPAENKLGEMNSDASIQPGSQPGNGEPSDRKEDLLTRDQVNQILRGQGKELEKTREQLGAFQQAEQKRQAEHEQSKTAELEEQGEFKTLLEQERKEKKVLSKQLEEMIAAKQTRLESVNAKNEERLKALPKDLRSLIHPSLGIEEKADQITAIEKMLKDEKLRVHGGTGRTEPPAAPEDNKTKWELAGQRYLQGGKGK